MKTSEAIQLYRDAIAETMIEHYREVLECGGRCQYKVYVWEDGEIECLLGPQGDNTYLAPRDAEPRELFYVTTVGGSYFDPWDSADHSAPEDDAEREAEEKEIIDWVMDEYKQDIDDQIDRIIERNQIEEKFDE